MNPAQDDFERLAQIAKAMQPAPRDFSGIWEQFTRVLTAITAAGIVWLLQSTSDLKSEVAVMKSEQQGLSKTIDELKVIADLPRFTDENYRHAIAPLEQTVRRNESDITTLKTAVSAMERMLMKLEKDSGGK